MERFHGTPEQGPSLDRSMSEVMPLPEKERAAETARQFAVEILRKQIEPIVEVVEKFNPNERIEIRSPKPDEALYNPQLYFAKREMLKSLETNGALAYDAARYVIEGEIAKTSDKLRTAMTNIEMTKVRVPGVEASLSLETIALQQRMAELQTQLDALPDNRPS
jgi:hypothetical protein